MAILVSSEKEQKLISSGKEINAAINRFTSYYISPKIATIIADLTGTHGIVK